MTVIFTRQLRKDFHVSVKAGRFRRATRVVPAVDGVSLTIESGQTIGYLGPNGAGKSTTLKMLTGVLMPSSGEISVCGLTPVPQRVRLARQIGVVFGQRSQLWWDLPLGDSFDLLRHIYRVPADDHRARLVQCRKMLELDTFLDTPVRQLSLGQRMRGEITAALLHGPRVLFLDEPTIGLDVVSKQAVRGFLSELGQRGDTTIVLTTHDLADIERLCQRIVVIDHGRVVHDGTIDALHARYDSRRMVTVEMDHPIAEIPEISGVRLDSARGTQLVFALNGGASLGTLFAELTALGTLRDLSVQEPGIEDVITRLYQSGSSTRVTSTDQ